MKNHLLLVNLFGWTAFAAPTAFCNVIQIDESDFASTARIEDFEENTNSNALPVNPDFQFVKAGHSTSRPFFGGGREFAADMFGHHYWTGLIGSGGTSDLALEFVNLQPAVGLWVGHVHAPNVYSETATFEILDDLGNVLASTQIAVPPQGAAPVFLGFASDVGIRRAQVIGDHIGFFGVDNITYGPVVPEPTTAALTAIGLLSLIALCVRKKLPLASH